LIEPPALAKADPLAVEEMVRPCGFYRQKAARLKGMAIWVAGSGGMAAVARMDTVRLREELLSLEGVGKETADAILAFAFNRPRFVAAAYTIRVLRRTGAMPSADYDSAQIAVQTLRGDDVASLRSDYAAFVEIAKNHCRQKPKCAACPLRFRCEYANG
jgi:endonuclease-3 related protein